jgi:hypothetical protein
LVLISESLRGSSIERPRGTKAHTGVIALVGEEGGDLRRRVDGVVGCEFGHREPIKDIILGVVDILAEVLFHKSIRILSLAVGFGMVGCRETNCNLETVTHSFPELGDKQGSSIRDNRVWEAVEAPDITSKDLG